MYRNQIGNVEIREGTASTGFHPYISITVVNGRNRFPMKAMVDTGCGPNIVMTYKQAEYAARGAVTYRTPVVVRVGDNRQVPCTVRVVSVEVNGQTLEVDVLVLPATKESFVHLGDIIPTEADIPLIGLSIFENKCLLIQVKHDGEFSIADQIPGRPS